jgi:hypothetical protein
MTAAGDPLTASEFSVFVNSEVITDFCHSKSRSDGRSLALIPALSSPNPDAFDRLTVLFASSSRRPPAISLTLRLQSPPPSPTGFSRPIHHLMLRGRVVGPPIQQSCR